MQKLRIETSLLHNIDNISIIEIDISPIFMTLSNQTINTQGNSLIAQHAKLLGEMERPQFMILLTILTTILTLLPILLMSITCFTRFVMVFFFARQSIGAPNSPPNTILMILSFWLTCFVIQPVMNHVYNQSVAPYYNGQLTESAALQKTHDILYPFILKNTRQEEIVFIKKLKKIVQDKQIQNNEILTPSKTISDTQITQWIDLIPAFILSELHRAFKIGFAIFLPMMILDFVVASSLMALGMMMVPPATIAMPLKLILFVSLDGWKHLCEALTRGIRYTHTEK